MSSGFVICPSYMSLSPVILLRCYPSLSMICHLVSSPSLPICHMSPDFLVIPPCLSSGFRRYIFQSVICLALELPLSCCKTSADFMTMPRKTLIFNSSSHTASAITMAFVFLSSLIGYFRFVMNKLFMSSLIRMLHFFAYCQQNATLSLSCIIYLLLSPPSPHPPAPTYHVNQERADQGSKSSNHGVDFGNICLTKPFPITPPPPTLQGHFMRGYQ
jgi:hypothetical protein